MNHVDNDSVLFQFQKGELEALLKSMQGLTVTAQSPFAETVGLESVPLPTDLLALKDQPTFRTIAEALAAPKAVIRGVKGGGRLQMEEFFLLKASTGWVVVLQNQQNQAVIQFSSAHQTGEWLSNTFGVRAENAVRNLLPAPIRQEDFTVLLHALDGYRRVRMESMLVYRPEEDLPTEEFVASYTVAINSEDIRWLLPAAFHLVPHISSYPPPDISAMSSLVEHHLADRSDINGTADRIVFSAEGKTLGASFATGWMYGLGLTINGSNQVEEPAILLLPTSLGNHMFTFGDAIQHHMLTHKALESFLIQWLQQFADDPAPVAPANFCNKCGNRLVPSVKFCGKCGGKVG